MSPNYFPCEDGILPAGCLVVVAHEVTGGVGFLEKMQFAWESQEWLAVRCGFIVAKLSNSSWLWQDNRGCHLSADGLRSGPRNALGCHVDRQHGTQLATLSHQSTQYLLLWPVRQAAEACGKMSSYRCKCEFNRANQVYLAFYCQMHFTSFILMSWQSWMDQNPNGARDSRCQVTITRR